MDRLPNVLIQALKKYVQYYINMHTMQCSSTTVLGCVVFNLKMVESNFLCGKIEIGLSIGRHVANVVVAIFINFPILWKNVTCLLVNLMTALMLQCPEQIRINEHQH